MKVPEIDHKLCMHMTVVGTDIILPNNQRLHGKILGGAKVVAPTHKSTGGSSCSKFGL